VYKRKRSIEGGCITAFIILPLAGNTPTAKDCRSGLVAVVSPLRFSYFVGVGAVNQERCYDKM